MNQSAVGSTLRMVGLLIEAFCLIVLFRTKGQGRMVYGLRLEMLLYAGLLAGFTLWLVGRTMIGLAMRRDAEKRARGPFES